MSQNMLRVLPAEPPTELVPLLEAIAGKLDYNFVSKTVGEELKSAENEMSSAKGEFISNQIMVEEIKLLLSEQHSDEPSPKLGGALRTLDSLLSVAEASQYLEAEMESCDGQQEAVISIEDLEAAGDLNREDFSERIDEMRYHLLPILELRYRKRCEALAAFCDYRPGYSFGRTSAVPGFIKAKKDRLSLLREDNENQVFEQLLMLVEQEQVSYLALGNGGLH
jgi:hypothetical protein